MKENRIVIIAVCAVLLVVVIFYLSVRDEGPRYQWYEYYRASNDQPYGLSFIHKMLQSYRPDARFTMNDKTPVSHLLKEIDDPGKTDYVFIGNTIYLDEDGTGSLARFIEEGGNVFIASQHPPEELLNAVYFKECGREIFFLCCYSCKWGEYQISAE